MLDHLIEKGWVPEPLIRAGIRKLLSQRLKEESLKNSKLFLDTIVSSPLAVSTQDANIQHYEVPTSFYQKVLGPRLKYSCAWFDSEGDSLAQAEEKMLALTCERAEIKDGMEILELGCGWGSLSLWMAEKYPNSKVTSVSNSRIQKIYIDAQAKKHNLENIEVITKDMNVFSTDLRFDRVVSVEMFEHMRNIELLFKSVSSWLKTDGKLFVHIFSHQRFSYLFEDNGPSDWMSRHFFTGGMMPSHSLYSQFESDLKIECDWVVPGGHYAKTSEAWLKNMSANESTIKEIFRETYGKGSETKWWARWRIFFMACAELWGFKNGQEWQVSHYLFKKSKVS
jgi:cyclopropane-fatty-acyl-phospholipid synthase